MKTTLKALVLGLIVSSFQTTNASAVVVCSAHPQLLRGTITGRVDLRNGIDWMFESITGTIDLALNAQGTNYIVTAFNGQSAVQGQVNRCFVNASSLLNQSNAVGALGASPVVQPSGAVVARAFGQIDLVGSFWSTSQCPWGTSQSVMNHLGPMLGMGQNETFICEANKPARFVGSSSGTLSSGGRAQYQWNMTEVLPTPVQP